MVDRGVVRPGTVDDASIDLAEAFRALFGQDATAPGVLHAIAGHLPLAAFAAGPDGTITTAFGSALDVMGLGDGRLVGASVDDLGPTVREKLGALERGRATVFDVDRSVSGRAFRHRIFGVPDGAGGAYAVMVDLSDAREAEEAIDKSRAVLESALELSGLWMIVQDARGTILSANTAARVGLGIEWGVTDTVESFARLDPVHADGERFTRDESPAQVARRERVAQHNVVMGLLDDRGERRWMTVSAVPVELGDELAVVTTLSPVVDLEPSAAMLRDSDERFRLLAEEAPIGIFIVGADGQMLYVNPASERIAGRPTGELRDVGWLACIHPDDQQALVERNADFDNFEPVEYRVLRPDGDIRWVRASGAALRDGRGTVIGLVGTATDVTEIRDADERLRDREERTRAILESAAEGIVTTDERGTIVEFNAAAERIFGYDSDEVIDRQRFERLLDEDARQLVREFMAGYLADPTPVAGARTVGAGSREITGRRKDGTTVPIELSVTDLHTRQGRLFTAVIRDLSEQKAFEHELERLATHDPLTGLPNRTLITAQLESALVRADRQRRLLGVLFVDIDRVKLVTEALGHRAGDELIAQAADRLRRTAGLDATLGRFSNDQFVAVLEDLDDVGSAVDVAIEMIDAISHPFVVAADEAFVHASVGIAFAVDGLGNAETLVSNADVAMGRAKASTHPRYEVFDADMRAWVEVQRKTEIALRHGIDRHEFELFYQPVVELETGEVCGYEALARWNHPEHGLLAPSEFIPVAEESGLVVQLGELLLRDAIRQSARWRDGDDARSSKVAINLSARQLEDPGLAALVRTTLEEFGADPDDVTFEITETVLLDDVETVVHTLDELKALGVHLSLDDFGTGYSSLTYLCQLPIDTVKVDRSFVSQLGTGSRDATIVEMVVTMARTLQLDVVAEGVETEHQAEVLRRWGCRYAQGFLFARPTPVADLAPPD